MVKKTIIDLKRTIIFQIPAESRKNSAELSASKVTRPFVKQNTKHNHSKQMQGSLGNAVLRSTQPSMSKKKVKSFVMLGFSEINPQSNLYRKIRDEWS